MLDFNEQERQARATGRDREAAMLAALAEIDDAMANDDEDAGIAEVFSALERVRHELEILPKTP